MSFIVHKVGQVPVPMTPRDVISCATSRNLVLSEITARFSLHLHAQNRLFESQGA